MTKFIKARIMRLVLIESLMLEIKTSGSSSVVEHNLAKVGVASSSLVFRSKLADIAHLVERNLAKVEVASSSLVVRSNFFDSKLETGWTRSSVG